MPETGVETGGCLRNLYFNLIEDMVKAKRKVRNYKFNPQNGRTIVPGT